MTQMPHYEKLFVGGDLSGIQKFLYNISSKKAAVSLKGRSAYLSNFMEEVCDELEKHLIGKTERIYCSGGKFYLQTDNSEENVAMVERVARQREEELWQEHYGQLGLSICAVPFTENTDRTIDADGRQRQPISILWDTVSALFFRNKQQKFKHLLLQDYDNYFEPIPVGALTKVCAVTGIESTDCVQPPEFKKDNDEREEELYVLPSVKKQIDLGKKLRENEKFEDFETYADGSYMGVLRMDVDGLGKRFGEKGFESIRDYKVFSDRLTDFFEKELKKIQQKEYKEHLCIIYAGGDDIFVVGRWDKAIDFAERVHKEVKQRFGVDGLSISGGVAIVHPKFPIAKAAEQAGEAEDAAKRFNNGEKNAFHFLGRTVSWVGEFAFVKEYKDKFVALFDNSSLNTSLLHKMMLYASIVEKNKESEERGKPLDYTFYWHANYYLKRFEKGKPDAVVALCRDLRDKVINGGDPRKIQLVAVAARWAELLIRIKKNKENKDNN